MRLRIGSYNNKYWIECRRLLGWARMPSVSHWIECESIRWMTQYVAYYPTYEAARDEADKFLQRFSRHCAVYVNINQ
jgi:hypothetical protein